MACEYSNQLHKVRHWAEACLEQAFLPEVLFKQLPIINEQLNISCHDSDPQKPLLVAFFGGTGVGKSALLNRLAGENIAQSGIERPTSKEVTLFHHVSLVLNELPATLPFKNIQIKQHHDPHNRHVIWLDMPDFDSVDRGNQHQVLEWLPHIDILIYVVSPERYRDRKAWELLLAEGGKHAWLFVMNQWDRGQQEQIEDLRSQISLAGFKDPILFKTSCLNRDGDDFADLVRHIQGLSGQLQRQLLLDIQQQRRYQELSEWLSQASLFIKQADFTNWQASVASIWQTSSTSLQQGMDWSIRETAQYVSENIGPLKPLLIWDDWAQSRLEDALDEIALSALDHSFPQKTLRSDLQTLRNKASKTFHQECESALRRALRNPGNRLQRFLLVITAVTETLLPLIAMAIVGYQVFVGYYQSSLQERAFLGIEFAMHSGLLITLSWLIPFYLHRQLQPSRKTTAIKGLQAGSETALHVMGHEIAKICHKNAELQALHLQQLAVFQQQCQYQPSEHMVDDDIQRMISQS